MKLRNFFPLLALLPVSVLAGTVVYTDSRQHIPENLPPDAVVILLDEPEHLQLKMFGQLPADPEQATMQAKQVMSSPQWQQKQQQLVMAYRQVVHARELGIRKVPAVVFDDRDVVYGTTDVAQAQALRQQAGGGQ
jgi:integrating conjugative element protein (TIGR03757 family)